MKWQGKLSSTTVEWRWKRCRHWFCYIRGQKMVFRHAVFNWKPTNGETNFCYSLRASLNVHKKSFSLTGGHNGDFMLFTIIVSQTTHIHKYSICF